MLSVGIWLRTALMERAARMNAVVVFVALLFFGVVWERLRGRGLLLAFPIAGDLVKIVFGEIRPPEASGSCCWATRSEQPLS